jgi:hypothetical protein
MFRDPGARVFIRGYDYIQYTFLVVAFIFFLQKSAGIIVNPVNSNSPVRIRVRIDSPQPLVCRKRRLSRAVLRMRPEKPRSRVTAGVAR